MNSLRFTLSVLCVYFTVNTSYAAKERIGKLGIYHTYYLYFKVLPETKITNSGEIEVSVANYGFSECEIFTEVEESTYAEILRSETPTQIDFPFATSPTSSNYSCFTFKCTSTVTKVPALQDKKYHLDFTFTLIKGFLVDPYNPMTLHTIFSTDVLSKTKIIFIIGKVKLHENSCWNLTNKDNTKTYLRIIEQTFLRYMGLGPDDLQGTTYTFISFKREQ